MKKVLFPFRNNKLEEILNDSENQPKEFMYGSLELLKKNKHITFFNINRGKRSTILRKFLFIFEFIFVRKIRLGIPFEIFLEKINKYKDVDVIFCINDAISFSVLFWKKMGFIDAEIITLFHSLPERHNKYFSNSKLSIWIVKKLLSGSSKIIVLSSSAKYEMAKVFSIPFKKIEIFYFGADLNFWKYSLFNLRGRDYILAIGSDMNRDYQTLCQAVSGKYKMIIVSNKKIICNGVEVRSNISNKEVIDLYYGARIVVTPSVKLLNESSGLSTTVQAMACGTPVLISDSLPMRELFREDEEIFYFEPENSISLGHKLEQIWDNESLLKKVSLNARSKVDKELNNDNMVKQLEKIIDL